MVGAGVDHLTASCWSETDLDFESASSTEITGSSLMWCCVVPRIGRLGRSVSSGGDHESAADGERR